MEKARPVTIFREASQSARTVAIALAAGGSAAAFIYASEDMGQDAFVVFLGALGLASLVLRFGRPTE